MPDEAPSSSTSDSLFGNNASDLLRAGMDPNHGRSATPPGGWQPPQPEELHAMLPQYEVSAFLGRGGMGAVYRGRQLSLERPVAIKILPPGMEAMDASYAERFRHEAMALARLRHLSIVAVYDFGQTQDGMFYIAMELIEGTDVAHMVAQQGRLHSDHAMAITAHVCDALQYAHGQKIIHRDIKPSNIMVAYDGTVKVTDFGLAKILLEGQPGLTRSGMALGTLQYMAPETLTLGTAVDHRADIYAVGVMLYHMLTGLLPQGMFELPSLQVPGLDPRYDTIIARALRNDREQRYQSAHEMRRDLDAVLTQPITQVAGAHAHTAAAPPPKAGPPQRKPGQPYRPPQTQTVPARKNTAPQKSKKSSTLVWVGVAVIGAGMAFLPWIGKSGPEKKAATAADDAPATEVPAPQSAFLQEFTKDNPFTNSLGMKFVPVPGTKVLMCIHETCESEYGAFAKDIPDTEQRTHSKSDKPMEAVSINMANAFCAWLSKKEGRAYRLPTEQEWNFAAGTPMSEQPVNSIPTAFKDIKPAFQTQFPWGDQWPPPPGSGNYLDFTLASVMKVPGIEGYNDGYGNNAPVTSFKPNTLGFYDLGGNVCEWCVIQEDGRSDSYVLKGGSFVTFDRSEALSSFRTKSDPIYRKMFVGFRCVIDTASSSDQMTSNSGGIASAQDAQRLQEWQARRDPRQRLEKLRTHGGSPECEASVSAALEYLKNKQNPNGSWGTTDQVGSTALALLAYLGRGETAESTSYGDTIVKAVMFLIETGKKNTERIMATNIASPHAAAEHGMAACALGELYVVASQVFKTLPGMREALEQGIRTILKHQLLDGGWTGQEGGTGFNSKGTGSAFVSAWQCEALATAKLTGLTFDGLNASIPRAADFMLAFQITGQRKPPQPPETLEAMTGTCMRAMQITSSRNQAELATALRFSRDHFQSEPAAWDYADLYSWLFYTRAFFREGGENWRFWNKQMVPQLLGNQKPDGSWQRPSVFMGGSECDSTALGALMLETFYRDVMIYEPASPRRK
ncbi:MAG: protein kinase [Verrucomicrobia bacterium]|nr:protein kinase [Verrucomicrobiota bacterium]